MGNETSISPVIITDSREQCPLIFKTFRSERGTLTSGDYSLKGAEELFAVERKSIPDLVASLTSGRERFERELHRLRGYWFARLLVVGAEGEISAGHFRSGASPKSILHSLWCFEVRYRVAVVFQPDPDKAAKLVERWALFFSREIVKVSDSLTSAFETAVVQQLEH